MDTPTAIPRLTKIRPIIEKRIGELQAEITELLELIEYYEDHQRPTAHLQRLLDEKRQQVRGAEKLIA